MQDLDTKAVIPRAPPPPEKTFNKEFKPTNERATDRDGVTIMPGIEQESKEITNKDNNDQEQEEVKPLTLTDHLNKKLLNSFLERINSNDSQINRMLNEVSSTIDNENANEFD
ncbi:hypothetical protein CBL_04270 [Carabus blaptoides fortunei]